jgi:hypothetical protein
MGRGKFKQVDLENDRAFQNAVEGYADNLFGQARSPQETGALIQAAIKDEEIPQWRMVTRGLYRRLGEQTNHEPIVLTAEIYPKVKKLAEGLDEKLFPQAKALANKVEQEMSQAGPVTGLEVKTNMEQLKKAIPGKTTVDKQIEPIESLIPDRSRVNIKQDVVPGIENVGGIKAPDEKQLKGIHTDTTWQKIQTGEQLTGMRASTQYQEIPAGERMIGLNVKLKSEAPRQARALNFLEAHDLRSFLLDIRRTGEALPDRVQSMAGELAHDLDQAMAKGSLKYASATGKPVYQDWRVANESTKIGHEIFDGAVIKQALSRNPEDVVSVAFKKDALTETQRLRHVLQNHPETWQAYQRASLETLFKSAQMEGAGISGHLFASQAEKIGPAVLKETFGSEYQNIKNFIEIGKKMDMRPVKGDGPGLLWTELGMYLSVPSAAIGGVLASGSVWPLAGAVGTLSTYLWTTRHLSEMLNNKKTAPLLLQLMEMKPGTELFARTANQLAARYAGGDEMYLPGNGQQPVPAARVGGVPMVE